MAQLEKEIEQQKEHNDLDFIQLDMDDGAAED